MAPSSNYLVWIDLEMTGLDPRIHTIIEIATLITDSNLEIVAEGPDLAIATSEALLAEMDEWNTTHHGESGLLDLVRSSTVDLATAEQLTLDFVKAFCVEGSAPLCGNSIWQDRRFVHKYMPKLADWLHYRSIDVSSVKELARRWSPQVAYRKPTAAHRALDDIRQSVEELRYYRRHFFRLPGSSQG